MIFLIYGIYPQQAALYLADLVEGSAFVFRFAEREQFDLEDTWLDEANSDDRPVFENNRTKRQEKYIEDMSSSE